MLEVRSSSSFFLIAAWLGCCALATIAAVAVYVVAQQVGRRAADDVPRALVAEQVATLSSRGPTSTGPVDRGTALSSQSGPFVIVYDSAHRVVSSTAVLDDTTPGLPSGTLDDAVSRGGTSVTWQPRVGVREAVFAQPWTGPAGSGVVVAGVGLGATEDRARSVLVAVSAGWTFVVLALTAALVVLRRGTGRCRPAG